MAGAGSNSAYLREFGGDSGPQLSNLPGTQGLKAQDREKFKSSSVDGGCLRPSPGTPQSLTVPTEAKIVNYSCEYSRYARASDFQLPRDTWMNNMRAQNESSPWDTRNRTRTTLLLFSHSAAEDPGESVSSFLAQAAVAYRASLCC